MDAVCGRGADAAAPSARRGRECGAAAAVRRPSGTGGMSETASVTFTVFGMERFRDLGRLVGLANVEVVVDGVPIGVQGVRILQRPGGSLAAELPRFRHPDGRWIPSVGLPQALWDAIAAAVLEAWHE
jgi:hypothetical protein